MSEERDRALIEQFIAAYNGFDIEDMVARVAPGIRFENYSGGRLTDSVCGVDAFRALAERSRSLFSEREQRVRTLERCGDSYRVSIDYVGRLAVDVPDGPPAGTVIEIRGSSEYLLEDGKIAKLVDRS